jgi:hypothetical protein
MRFGKKPSVGLVTPLTLGPVEIRFRPGAVVLSKDSSQKRRALS